MATLSQEQVKGLVKDQLRAQSTWPFTLLFLLLLTHTSLTLAAMLYTLGFVGNKNRERELIKNLQISNASLVIATLLMSFRFFSSYAAINAPDNFRLKIAFQFFVALTACIVVVNSCLYFAQYDTGKEFATVSTVIPIVTFVVCIFTTILIALIYRKVFAFVQTVDATKAISQTTTSGTNGGVSITVTAPH